MERIERMEISFRELKVVGGPEEGVFSGYGACFGNTDSGGDVIAKGAFTKTIHDAKVSGQWPAMLEQHGGWGISASDLTPIGVWTEMEEDDVGLKLSGKTALTQRGQEMHILMKMTPRPAINGLSIGYIPIKFKMRSTPDEPRRTLEEVKLMEISPVTFPSNGKARVSSVKTIDELLKLSEIEDYLREAGGFSINEAKGLIARIKLSARGDADGGLEQITAALIKNTNRLKGIAA